MIQLEWVVWSLCITFQRWSTWNDEECKLYRNFNYIFSRRQGSQTTYLCSRVALNWASKCLTLHMNAHKTVSLMALKNDPKWCETRPIWSIIASCLSLHSFQATAFTISHFGPTQESFYLESSAPGVVIRCFSFFSYLACINPNCIEVGLLCFHCTCRLHAKFDACVSHPGRRVLFGYFSLCTHFS